MIKLAISIILVVIGFGVIVWEIIPHKMKGSEPPRWAMFWAGYLTGMGLSYLLFLWAIYNSTGKVYLP